MKTNQMIFALQEVLVLREAANKIPARQEGAVLIVGLIMLLLLTVIGLASIRGSDFQERMVGNMRDRNLAFQAAESALREGEDTATKSRGLAPPAVINSAGYWDDLNIPVGGRPARPVLWDKARWEASSLQMPADRLKGLFEAPRFVLEKLDVLFDSGAEGSGIDAGSPVYIKEYVRVTSRGLGGTADSEVVLQSTVAF